MKIKNFKKNVFVFICSQKMKFSIKDFCAVKISHFTAAYSHLTEKK